MPKNFEGLKFINDYGISKIPPWDSKSKVAMRFEQYESRVGYFAFMETKMPFNSTYIKYLGVFDTEVEATEIINKVLVKIDEHNRMEDERKLKEDERKIKEKIEKFDFLLRDIINEKQE